MSACNCLAGTLSAPASLSVRSVRFSLRLRGQTDHWKSNAAKTSSLVPIAPRFWLLAVDFGVELELSVSVFQRSSLGHSDQVETRGPVTSGPRV
eukprot:2859461-Rhodomonas_salina.1